MPARHRKLLLYSVVLLICIGVYMHHRATQIISPLGKNSPVRIIYAKSLPEQ